MHIYYSKNGFYREPNREEQPSTSRTDPPHQHSRPSRYTTLYVEATIKFSKIFLQNEFGHICNVCDRLWFQSDLKQVQRSFISLLQLEFPNESSQVPQFQLCATCRSTLSQKKQIPALSKSNGYRYPDHPPHLPPLDLISERLISPRLPFMQIRRLRQLTGSYKIIGQIINIPVDVGNMVQELPRQLDDDYAINISIKKHIAHKSSYLNGQVKKHVVKEWLRFLITTPLYRYYNITFNEDSLNNINSNANVQDSNAIPLDDIDTADMEKDNELLLAQQHTIHWDESKYVDIAPGQNQQPLSIIFDTYAEELSFPNIYYGTPRTIKMGVKATPFTLATSELRRRDRRGATPNHILYMAVKIMRFRVINQLKCTFKINANVTNVTRRMIEDKTYLDHCVDNNLAFLNSIPNSIQYWNSRKKYLFAMIRQLGKPTFFVTLSANEIRRPPYIYLYIPPPEQINQFS